MNNRVEFHHVLPLVDRFETCIENYLIQPGPRKTQEARLSHYVVFQEPCFEVKQPSINIWEFMIKEKLKQFLTLQNKSEIRKCISSSICPNRPKGKSRTIFIELMYNVTKFSKTSDFNLEKTGALLSQFYLTHLLFTSKLDMSPEKIYTYFKDLTMHHSLPFPPNHTKIFSHKETKDIMELFCKLYLRNLPLIRFVGLPNFAFYLNYELEPEPSFTAKMKKEKAPKGDKKGGKKDSKKGSSKKSK